MSVKNQKIIISTQGFDDLIDITSKIQDVIWDTKVKEGIANIFVKSSCASILILEDEPALPLDITKLLDSIVPINKVYQHDNNWHDGNAFSHLKSMFLGHNITLPIVESKIELDSYQRIVLIDFDNKASFREIVVSVVY